MRGIGRSRWSYGLRQVCDCSIVGITVLIPADGMDVSFHVLVVCRVCSFFCEGLITRAEESYRVRVSVCDLETSKGGGLGAIWFLATQKNTCFYFVSPHTIMG